MKHRNETKEKITSYLDGDAGKQFAEFHNQLRALREMLDTAHNVGISGHIVVGYIDQQCYQFMLVCNSLSVKTGLISSDPEILDNL